MEDIYSIVEFEDGLQMIPTSWLKNKNAAFWPQFTSHARFIKAVQKKISPEDNWPIYNIKRILGTASKLHKQNRCYIILCYKVAIIKLKVYNNLSFF